MSAAALFEMSIEVEPETSDDNGLTKRLTKMFQETRAACAGDARQARRPPPLQVESQALDRRV